MRSVEHARVEDITCGGHRKHDTTVGSRMSNMTKMPEKRLLNVETKKQRSRGVSTSHGKWNMTWYCTSVWTATLRADHDGDAKYRAATRYRQTNANHKKTFSLTLTHASFDVGRRFIHRQHSAPLVFSGQPINRLSVR